MKIQNLESEERRKIEEEVDAQANRLGFDRWEETSITSTLLEDQIGICYNCKNINYCKTEFGNVIATCDVFEMRLNGSNRMVECNRHDERGSMTLSEMYALATLIDPDSGSKVKGFISRKV